jgi:hypothetical protein
MRPWIEKLPLPDWLKVWAVEPVWGAIMRLSKPEVRIVTGGISFYALFSIFPIVYLTLSLLFAFCRWSCRSASPATVDDVLVSAVAPLSRADLETIRQVTPQGVTLRALLAVIIVLYTASSGAKAAITGIRMVTGSERRTRIIRFQGVSILMTALLILAVWLLGALQLILSFITEKQGFIAYDLCPAGQPSCLAALARQMDRVFRDLLHDPRRRPARAPEGAPGESGRRGGRGAQLGDRDLGLSPLSEIHRARQFLWRAGLGHPRLYLAGDVCVLAPLRRGADGRMGRPSGGAGTDRGRG